jgi:hypothetical protein
MIAGSDLERDRLVAELEAVRGGDLTEAHTNACWSYRRRLRKPTAGTE